MFGVPALIFAALVVVIRRRWAPLLGPFYWGLFLGANSPYLAHDLAHPELGPGFGVSVLLVLVALAGIAAGIGGTLQNLSGGGPRWAVPRWFSTGFTAAAGVALGALVVAAVAPTSASAGVSAEALAALPALTTAKHRFDQTELRARVGETVALRLENADATGHSFDIDALTLHVAMPPGEPGLALFTAPAAGQYTFYCSVPGHREAGMVGTLIVEAAR
jgi:uncharacterized cupredoxin-like copper-binding protein